MQMAHLAQNSEHQTHRERTHRDSENAAHPLLVIHIGTLRNILYSDAKVNCFKS